MMRTKEKLAEGHMIMDLGMDPDALSPPTNVFVEERRSLPQQVVDNTATAGQHTATHWTRTATPVQHSSTEAPRKNAAIDLQHTATHPQRTATSLQCSSTEAPRNP
mmetsp:Transcript_34650/g.55911  ORF Transcript_34650/g.55911 Transcript_34650/m.55911 type:complete len:106 (-) Transcript_34650:164-481(-)|eukprot:CAMPEP_0179432444 /NCGR_PEP_ID=MMETSP0799-20121207/17050_1 /TAXON_ID=46947 /ORGANISM="Geminigera cryophila, Strain CCMP2564" /LENGTH=105 /DNA_ID=CAMNT_0021209813 /DNA_START=43 /DNA_END=360 /DNA_ORIENTATION=-